MAREFTVVVEQGEKYLIGTVIGLHGAHSQGATLDELLANMREVIALCFEEEESAGASNTCILRAYVGLRRAVHLRRRLCPCMIPP